MITQLTSLGLIDLIGKKRLIIFLLLSKKISITFC
jgi:hypothetical protein